jgi:hypothetical protein
MLGACVVIAGCGAAGQRHVSQPSTPTPVASQWPGDGDYNTITTAVKVRDQALRLRPWNQKAYAARLGLGTLVSLQGKLLPDRCATFVGHIYAELTDLNQAYAGEDWRPMFVVVARDPTVASQCKPPPSFIGPSIPSLPAS